MNLGGLFKRNDGLGKALSELEDGMSDMLLAELSPPPMDSDIGFGDEGLDPLAEPEMQDVAPEQAMQSEPAAQPEPAAEAAPPAPQERPVSRMTPYAQGKISSLSAFEEMFQEARHDLQTLGAALAKVTSAHHMTREFLSTVHADIHRANELEIANTLLQGENRKLSRFADETAKRLGQRETTLEAIMQREAALAQEAESLRVTLTAFRLEAVESGNVIGRLESERADLMTELAGKNVTAEKLHRENEVTREKYINLSLDLDNTLKRQGETQRRLDELSALHSSEASHAAERFEKLAETEKQLARLHKQHDALQSRFQAVNGTIRALETELEDSGKRHAAEMQGVTKEIQMLHSKLQASGNAQAERSNEISALRVQLNDALSEKRIAAEKLESLRADNERDKKQLAAAGADYSELNMRQASEHAELDVLRQEADELRREVTELRETVKRLTPFERLQGSAKARQNGSGRKTAEAPKAEAPSENPIAAE